MDFPLQALKPLLEVLSGEKATEERAAELAQAVLQHDRDRRAWELFVRDVTTPEIDEYPQKIARRAYWWADAFLHVQREEREREEP